VQDDDSERAYQLAATEQWDAAAAALQERWPTGRSDDPYGENFERVAEWWEHCGDRLVMMSTDAAAAEAYHRAHDAFATLASWATSGGEGSARMIEVRRVAAKLAELDGP
jgi:hypothetical protein